LKDFAEDVCRAVGQLNVGQDVMGFLEILVASDQIVDALGS